MPFYQLTGKIDLGKYYTFKEAAKKMKIKENVLRVYLSSDEKWKNQFTIYKVMGSSALLKKDVDQWVAERKKK